MLPFSIDRSIILGLTLLSTCFLTGCPILTFLKNSEGEPVAMESDTNIKITSLRIPKKGETIEVLDPQSREMVRVVLGEVFTSASGKICSNFTVKEENYDKKRYGLACLNNRHEWDRNPLDIQIISGD